MSTQQIKKVSKEVAYWSMFVLLGIVVLFILMEAFLPKQTINIFQVRSYIVEYDTMEPTLKPNDLVFINKVDASKLESGDKVTFIADINYDGDTEMVTYYVDNVTSIDTDTYRITVIAEGANVPFGVITSDSLLGGYAFRIPVLGGIIKFIKSPFGIGTLVINGIIIAGIILIVKQGHNKDKQEEIVED